MALSEGLPPPRAWGPGASAWGWRPWSRQARDVAETEGGPGRLPQGKEQVSRPQGLALVTLPAMFLLAPFLLCEVNTQEKGAEGKLSPRRGLCSLGPGVGGWSWHQGCSELQPRGGGQAMPPPCQPVPGPLGTPKSLPLSSAEPSRRLPALGHRLGAHGPQGALKDCSSVLLPLAAPSPPAALLQPRSLQPWAPLAQGRRHCALGRKRD